jgi:zinc protease
MNPFSYPSFIPYQMMNKIFLLPLILFIFSLSNAFAETLPNDAKTFDATTFTLQNGMQVIVIPNHRAPVITHMIWIRAGAADEPESVSGVAHFLEHLMFKGTKKEEPGAYSKKIRAIGGDDNAFTGQDYTAYFATLPSSQLDLIMSLERDRLENLTPPLPHIESEKKVIIEERRQRTENDPYGPLYEQINAYLFASTPYDNPVIGWMKDMEKLTYHDVQAFYKTWYTPQNMILILSGDITPERAQKMATAYYADLKQKELPQRQRLSPPIHPAQTTLRFESDQIAQSALIMAWRVPSYAEAPQDAIAFDLVQNILAGGNWAPLYQELVVRQKIAVSVSMDYDGNSLNGGSFWISATPAPGITLDTLQKAIWKTLASLPQYLTPAAQERATTRLLDQVTFMRDSVSGPAMIVGQAMTTGLSLEDVQSWPARVRSIPLKTITHTFEQFLSKTGGVYGPPLITEVIAKNPAGGASVPSLLPFKGPHS